MQRLVNTKEAAELIDMSKSWLDQARYRGDGPPFIKVGRSVRYRPADLERWLDERRFGG